MTGLCATVSIATPLGEETVVVEVVATRPEIEHGLMYRTYLSPNAGMLFLMEMEAVWAFYMRNTLIPLDMIFIDSNLTVVGVVANAEPCTETLRSVGKQSRYVLEVNGGWAAANQVGVGARVRFGEYENLAPVRP